MKAPSSHFFTRCAPGYYGNPMRVGSSCKKCDCNGNTDPNLIFNECHNVTGQCLHCWDNTAGHNCERCAPGYYGDAIGAKDCLNTDCMVNAFICVQEGYSGFSSCQGCRRCECAPAGLRATCHPLTHTCQCQPGAGGRYCERCLPGHWDYTPNGCKSDILLNVCDGDSLSECDECIWHLIGDVRQSNKTVDQLRNTVLNISTGAAANDRIKYYNYTALRLQVQTHSHTQPTQSQQTLEQGSAVKFGHRPEIFQAITWWLYSVQQEVNPAVQRQKQLEAERMLNWIKELDLSPKEPLTTQEFSQAQERKCVHVLLSYHAEVDVQQTHTSLLTTLNRSDANGFVQKALDASNVYDNIVKYINDANITSLTTLNQSQRAEDVSDGVSLHFKYSYKCVCVCVCVCVWSARQPLQLQVTLEATEVCLNRSTEVLDTVTPIKERVEEWNRNMRNNQYSTHAYEQAVDSAQDTVADLSEIVPTLLTKLRSVEEAKPVNNVTTNIMRIRELIAQARSVARKVQVSMKFNGQSAVEVQPHSNLDELKAVTSISLYVRVDPDKDPIEDRFLLYLGDKNGGKDYMGLAIKNDNLVFVYNLGGEDVEISLTSKPVSSWPPVFNLVRVERLGRHGKVFLTVPSQETTAEQKFIQKGEADGTDSLFHLDPKNTVFIVGGVPPDIKLPPALSLAPFVGCIELATLNNDVISLYNFKKLHMMNVVTSVPCPRYKLAFSQGRVSSYLFDGMGYALVNNIERRGRIGVVTRFDIEVRTVANNGILFLMVNQSNFFVLELKNGFLRLVYDFGFANGPIVMESNLAKLQINDARYHEVSVIYHFSKKVVLLVDRGFVKSMENEKKPLPFSDIYIGGAPSNLLLSRPELSSLVGLRGCVKGFQFQKKDFNLLEEPGTIGISSGCPEESFMSRQAYFTGEGYLSSTAKISPFSSFEGGMNFRTLQSSGLLFYYNEGPNEFTLSLENGAVVLHSKGTKVKSQKKNYSDGRPHFLVVSVTKDKQEKKNSDSSQTENTLKTFFYGGSPYNKIQNFSGCISYTYISRQDRDIEAEDFQRYTENGNVSLQDCPVERPPAALMDKTGVLQGILGLQSDPIAAPEAEAKPCYMIPQSQANTHAHQFSGSAHSRQEYDGVAEGIRERSHFSMSVKTQSAAGVVLYVSDESEENFLSLYLSHGKLFFTFGSGQQKLRLRTTDTYNDGQWHDVRDTQLIVDRRPVVENRNFPILLQDPLYVGGVSPGRALKHIPTSVSSLLGCVKDLQLNGRRISSVSCSFGVTPCLEGPVESGAYFSEEGGYVVLDDSFSLGLKFEVVVEVRPRVVSGVLLHVFSSSEEYLTVYLHQGQVTVNRVNSGVGVFSTHVTPQEAICDGNWHKITVIRDSNVVQLIVDSEVTHVVGPVSPITSNTETTRAPVFIGGAPDSLLPVGVVSRRGFSGCMRNLFVGESAVDLSKAALVSGAVSLSSCPAA
uniref:Laminin, alpha 4 n=1 Tax=Astyanax mexicanus TaxID=7994 RepID=A0A8B9L3L4_ASTMX